MNNVIMTVRNNQVNLKDSLNLLQYMHAVLPASYKPISNLRTISQEKLDILNAVLKYIGVYGHTYVSHKTISHLSGACRDTIIEAMKFFKEYNILAIVNRGANKSCVYSLGSFLLDETNQWRLREAIPNIYWAVKNAAVAIRSMLNRTFSFLSKSFLLSTPVQRRTPTRLSNDKYINTKKEERPMKEYYQEISDNNKLRQEMYHYTPIYDPIGLTMKTLDVENQVRIAMKIENLHERVNFLKKILYNVPGASVPYIKFLIMKYEQKLL